MWKERRTRQCLEILESRVGDCETPGFHKLPSPLPPAKSEPPQSCEKRNQQRTRFPRNAPSAPQITVFTVSFSDRAWPQNLRLSQGRGYPIHAAALQRTYFALPFVRMALQAEKNHFKIAFRFHNRCRHRQSML